MDKTDPPAKVASNDQLGPNALTYARERVSLLGAGEHMDTVNRALDALEGLPVAALLGGWTFKGFTAWAQGLESEIARLTAALKQANDQAEHFEREWYLRGDEIERLRDEALRFDREPPPDCKCASQCMARGAYWRKCSLALGPND